MESSQVHRDLRDVPCWFGVGVGQSPNAVVLLSRFATCCFQVMQCMDWWMVICSVRWLDAYWCAKFLSKCSSYCFRYGCCLRIAGLSLILHCSTSGKSDQGMSIRRTMFDKVETCKSGEPPGLYDFDREYQWFLRNWKGEFSLSFDHPVFSLCTLLLGSIPILQVANLTGLCPLNSQCVDRVTLS